MRKIRGWVGNNDFSPVQLAKPSALSFQLDGTIVSLKWIDAIGCIEGYKIYGGRSVNSLEQIGETKANNYSRQLSQNDYPYFISVSAFHQNLESERTLVIKIREEVYVPESKQFEKIVTEIISEPVSKQTISEHLPKQTLNQPESFPYGLCTCCMLPQPLMKRKEKIVCSRNTKNIYTQTGSAWVIQPQQIISDIGQMDELLRQNSAYVGIGGVLVNNKRF